MHESELTKKSGARPGLLLFLVLFGAAMGFCEAAVVMYLREIIYPEGFAFPLRMIGGRILAVETGRELSTVVMLTALALLAGKSFYERFAFFSLAFATWDIFYYIWLKLLLGWPESLLTWDILFLIPLPWIAPVLSPIIVSLCLIAGAVLILRRLWSGGVFELNLREWLIASGGAFLVFLSYIADLDAGKGFSRPAPYRWELLAVGVAAGYYALSRCLFRTREGSTCS